MTSTSKTSASEDYGKLIRDFLTSLSNKLGIGINRLLDLYFWVSDNVKAKDAQLQSTSVNPTRVEIIRIIDDGTGIKGIRLRFSSDTRRGEYHYTVIGKYGAKCTCEGNMIGNRVCKHIVAGLILMDVINVLKYGRNINLDEFKWISKAGEGGLREDSEGLQGV